MNKSVIELISNDSDYLYLEEEKSCAKYFMEIWRKQKVSFSVKLQFLSLFYLFSAISYELHFLHKLCKSKNPEF